MPGETFAQALAKVDVEVSDVRDSGAPVYTVLGLKEVEAAHRAEVARAVAAEREACAKVCEAISTEAHDMNCPVAARYCGECADAIRARGGA